MNISNFEQFLAAFPHIDQDEETGGGCAAWRLDLPDGGHALITRTDDPSPPLPSDERVAVGFYNDDGEEPGYEVVECSWREAASLIMTRVDRAGGVS
jgi:hypothetical protein